ncbi:major facilitator superfamily domain-containing protein [Vararia minispora EC-137]|uniref:Major facilitator superfamily domain-containing protein n=1 Tax=Vararia minispora EC-137 TaxID=1314806 RepID=A0ACB8QPS0_9AGAM|nr:major facilitator superfamily domain-containing protein [Vararia minispora EC-137]
MPESGEYTPPVIKESSDQIPATRNKEGDVGARGLAQTSAHAPPKPAPWGLRWRASVWFITLVVGLGITTDIIVYSILIPVLPFQLQKLGYTGISALVGYLLFAYSGGLAISTPPIAWLSELYKSRQWPLIIGLVALIGSQIMLMEAPTYWVMAFARVLQGISSSMVWVVGLALLCDTTPEKYVGHRVSGQLGIAMSGLGLGLLIGPAVGGALYSRFGFRGPCIFGIITAIVDLLGRLLLVERKDAIQYGFDPAAALQAVSENTAAQNGILRPEDSEVPAVGIPHPTSLSPLAALWEFAKSPRALTALSITFSWAVTVAGQEPTIPLHLQSVWGLNSSQVGLVFIAAVVPTFFSSPFAGWCADKWGAEWVTVLYISLSLPWMCLLVVEASLAFFIVMYGLNGLFVAALAAPVTAELAAVSRSIPDIGYAHVYGAFNLAYGIGSAIGPIIGGQIYNHVANGWLVLCFLFASLLALTLFLALVYTGDRPILMRLVEKIRRMGTITLPEEPTEDVREHVPVNNARASASTSMHGPEVLA